ncbi:hypothetical protein ACFL0G_04760 [Candidatus Zixiibacteriota bacterium]
MMRKPKDIPEQKIAGGPGAIGKYATACRQEFKACLRGIFLEVSQRALAGENDITQQVSEKALACYDRFFQVMKGGTNIHREDLRRALLAEERRQRDFYRSLRWLAERFVTRGVRFQIAEAGHFEDQTLWGEKINAGCRIETDNGVSLFACPLLSLNTSEYMVPRAGPIAAQLIFLNQECMIFMKHGEDPGKTFAAAAGEFFGGFKDVAGEIAGIHLARLYDHHLEISIIEELSTTQLEELRTRYQVPAVYKGDPHDFTALITIGPEEDLPRLLREIGDW